jgi:two-component system sensor histidine kinase ChvG
VAGAVVVSQSTYRILQALYEVRLRLFEIVLLSMASAAVLTWLASSTIVNPIVRLRYMAAALASRPGD